jgi:hypothetical protein
MWKRIKRLFTRKKAPSQESVNAAPKEFLKVETADDGRPIASCGFITEGERLRLLLYGPRPAYSVQSPPDFSAILAKLSRDITAFEVTDDLEGQWRIERVGPVDGRGGVK